MEGTLRIGLLIIAGIVLLLTVYETWNARRRLKLTVQDRHEPSIDSDFEPLPDEFLLGKSPEEDKPNMVLEPQSPPTRVVAEKAAPVKNNVADNLLVMSVIAKPQQRFESYELLQAITSTGMRFGEMNIFHYYVEKDDLPALYDEENSDKPSWQEISRNVSLFSLASATKPGTFDLDKIGNFSCTGLTLFMDLHASPNPHLAFEIMLNTAQQLADDLEGELRAGQRDPWNDETVKQYQRKVLQYQYEDEYPAEYYSTS